MILVDCELNFQSKLEHEWTNGILDCANTKK